MLVVHADRPGSLPDSLVDFRCAVLTVCILQSRCNRLHSLLRETICDAVYQALIKDAKTSYSARRGRGEGGVGVYVATVTLFPRHIYREGIDALNM